jgi:hypothetical protein
MCKYYFEISFGSGNRFLHRDSAARRLRRFRSGCCALRFPPLLPILRRKFFTAVFGIILFQVAWENPICQSLDCLSTIRRGRDFGEIFGAGERLGALKANPRAFALEIPAFRRCTRSAAVIAFGRPLLRLPSADMTAEMVAFVGGCDIGLQIRGAFCMPSCFES